MANRNWLICQFRCQIRQTLLNYHENVVAMDNVPVASMAMPIPVLMGMPVSVIPVVVGVHYGASMDHCFGVRFLSRYGYHSEQREGQQ
jgi:hypothetical protein